MLSRVDILKDSPPSEGGGYISDQEIAALAIAHAVKVERFCFSIAKKLTDGIRTVDVKTDDIGTRSHTLCIIY